MQTTNILKLVTRARMHDAVVSAIVSQ